MLLLQTLDEAAVVLVAAQVVEVLVSGHLLGLPAPEVLAVDVVFESVAEFLNLLQGAIDFLHLVAFRLHPR